MKTPETVLRKLAKAKRALKYSDDQPRDTDGRFGEGDGGGAQSASDAAGGRPGGSEIEQRVGAINPTTGPTRGQTMEAAGAMRGFNVTEGQKDDVQGLSKKEFSSYLKQRAGGSSHESAMRAATKR